MEKIPMVRRDVALLAGIVVFAAIIFLPWTHDVTIARVSLFAWLMFALMALAPLAGLLVALSQPKDGE